MQPTQSTSRSTVRHEFFHGQAARLARSGHYDDALHCLSALHEEAGACPRTLCLLGKVHVQRGDLERGREAFVEALTLDPGMVEAAAALAKLARLRQPVPAQRLQIGRLAVAGLVLLSLMMAGTGLHAWHGSRQASGSLASAPAGVSAAGVSPRVHDCRLFAASLGLLRPFCDRWDLAAEPTRLAGELAIKLTGRIPSSYVRARIASLSLPLPLDDSDLAVSGRYRVGPGETLGSISEEVYGAARGWPRLWHANKDRLPNPHLIRPGMILAAPAE